MFQALNWIMIIIEYQNMIQSFQFSMGTFTSKWKQKQEHKRGFTVLFAGLDGAGKTTILYTLKDNHVSQVCPTQGFNTQCIPLQKVKLFVWDLSGRLKLRSLWGSYLQTCKALIFVVDSSDRDRVGQAAHQLKQLLNCSFRNCSALLILANKMDKQGMGSSEIAQKMGLNELRINWSIFPVSTTKEQFHTLDEPFKWLSQNLISSTPQHRVIKVNMHETPQQQQNYSQSKM